MLPICSTLAVALVLAQTSVAMAAARLQGLDHVYFEYVGGPENPLAVPSSVAGLLPEGIQPTYSSPKTKIPRGVGQEADIEVRDFRLPLQRIPRELTLRQIVVGREFSRITELWWALYDDGRRTDVWYFSANPNRSEHKILSNYEIEAASVSARGALELRVRGMMFRPQGAWWITGKVFSFSVHDEKLLLAEVRNVFGFFRDYDIGNSPPTTDVSMEREEHGRFESLTYKSVPNGTLRACGFREPLSDENWEFSWVRMERVALCITGKSSARASHRGFDEPSFVERGGRASE